MATQDLNEVHWIKSSRSNEGGTNCVELATFDGNVLVRDSKLGDASPVLTFTPAEVAAFLAGAKDSEFDHLV
jgi:hypothetical protein